MNPNANVYIPTVPCSQEDIERNHLSVASEMRRRGIKKCKYERRVAITDVDVWDSGSKDAPGFGDNLIYRFAEPTWRKFRDLGEFAEHGADEWWFRYVGVKNMTTMHRVAAIDIEDNKIRIGTSEFFSLDELFANFERAQYLEGQWVFTPAGVEGM